MHNVTTSSEKGLIKSNPHLIHFILILLPFLIMTIFWILIPSEYQLIPSTDFLNYYEPIARSIHNGSLTRYLLAPGYPLYLSFLFQLTSLTGIAEHYLFAIAAIINYSLSSFLLFRISSFFFGNKGILSAIIWITCPYVIWMANTISSEMVFILLFFSCLYLFILGVWNCNRCRLLVFFAGMLSGGASLIRPIGIGISLVLALFLVLKFRPVDLPQRFTLIGFLLVGNLLIVLPWLFYVYFQTGQIIPISTHGANSLLDGLTYAIGKEYRSDITVSPEIRVLMESILAQSINAERLGRPAVLLLLEVVSEKPVVFFKLLGLKLIRCWFATDSGRFETPLIMIQLFYISVSVVAAIRMLKMDIIRIRFIYLIGFVVLYFWLMTFMALSILRYMVPSMGIMFTSYPACFSRCSVLKKL